jgi:ribosomal protein L30E
MEQKIKERLKEKIKNNAVSVGKNSTVRAAEKKELEFIVYASNASPNLIKDVSNLGVEIYKYEGDSEALSIACSKSFNISVIGAKK